MVNRNRKLNFERIFFNQKFLSLVGLVAVILISYPFIKSEIRQYRVNREIDGLKKEIADLQNKGADLKNFVSYLESDQFAEEQARLNLGLKKPGEELMIIKPGLNEAVSPSSTAGNNQIFNIPGYQKSQPAAEASNPAKWLNYFFK